MTIRAVAYVRVSSARQASEGLSLDEQQRRTEAYIAAMGWEHVGTYVGRPCPAPRRSRSARVRRLLDDLDSIDRIVIPKLDRLGRSTRDLLDVWTGSRQAGVGDRSLWQSIDTPPRSGG